MCEWLVAVWCECLPAISNVILILSITAKTVLEIVVVISLPLGIQSCLVRGDAQHVHNQQLKCRKNACFLMQCGITHFTSLYLSNSLRPLDYSSHVSCSANPSSWVVTINKSTIICVKFEEDLSFLRQRDENQSKIRASVFILKVDQLKEEIYEYQKGEKQGFPLSTPVETEELSMLQLQVL